MQSLPISLCMIVKDEEKYLPACLESAADIVSEIIIVDTGSTDNTITIAESFGAQIYHFEWIDDFSAARNYAIDQASMPWILQLDADEEIAASSIPWFYDNYPWLNKWGYLLNIKLLSDLQSNELQFTHRLIRFFRNSQNICYQNRIHEMISIPSDKVGISPVEIIHKGYAERKADDLRYKQNEKLLLEEIEKNPGSGTLHAYLALHYSTLRQDKKAFKIARKALEIGIPVPLLQFSITRIIFAYAYNSHNNELLEKLFSETDEDDYPTKHFFMGMYLLGQRKKNQDEAKSHFERFLALIQSHNQREHVLNAFIGIANQRLGIIEMKNNNFEDSISYLKKALENSPSLYQSNALLGKAYHQNGDALSAKKCFEKLITQLKLYQPPNFEHLISRYQSVIDALQKIV